MMSFLMLMITLSIHQVGEIAVLPTANNDEFKVIYKGDLKWNAVVVITNEKGKAIFETKIPDTDSFLLPIDMSNEVSGKYTVKISTPVYDLTKEFTYQKYIDEAAEKIDITYDMDRHLIRLTTSESLTEPFLVFIYNESGDRLISDEVGASSGLTMRTYKLEGAPAKRLLIFVEMSAMQIRREEFTY